MTIFVWKRLEGVTDSYHHEGGVLVVARDYARAKELVGTTVEPDFSWPVADYDAGAEEQKIVFPDAGCC